MDSKDLDITDCLNKQVSGMDREALLEDVRILNQFGYRRFHRWTIVYQEIPEDNGRTERSLVVSNEPLGCYKDTTPVRFFPCEVAAIAQAYRDGKMPELMQDPGEMPAPIPVEDEERQ